MDFQSAMETFAEAWVATKGPLPESAPLNGQVGKIDTFVYLRLHLKPDFLYSRAWGMMSSTWPRRSTGLSAICDILPQEQLCQIMFRKGTSWQLVGMTWLHIIYVAAPNLDVLSTLVTVRFIRYLFGMISSHAFSRTAFQLSNVIIARHHAWENKTRLSFFTYTWYILILSMNRVKKTILIHRDHYHCQYNEHFNVVNICHRQKKSCWTYFDADSPILSFHRQRTSKTRIVSLSANLHVKDGSGLTWHKCLYFIGKSVLTTFVKFTYTLP